jgi:hypothetical protein
LVPWAADDPLLDAPAQREPIARGGSAPGPAYVAYAPIDQRLSRRLAAQHARFSSPVKRQ